LPVNSHLINGQITLNKLQQLSHTVAQDVQREQLLIAQLLEDGTLPLTARNVYSRLVKLPQLHFQPRFHPLLAESAVQTVTHQAQFTHPGAGVWLKSLNWLYATTDDSSSATGSAGAAAVSIIAAVDVTTVGGLQLLASALHNIVAGGVSSDDVTPTTAAAADSKKLDGSSSSSAVRLAVVFAAMPQCATAASNSELACHGVAIAALYNWLLASSSGGRQVSCARFENFVCKLYIYTVSTRYHSTSAAFYYKHAALMVCRVSCCTQHFYCYKLLYSASVHCCGY
jgi:hypothetical protein